MGGKEDDKVYWKSDHSMVISTSPAFEFSMYTAMALLFASRKQREPRVKVDIAGCQMIFVVVIGVDGRDQLSITSIYPENLGPETGQCKTFYESRCQKCNNAGHNKQIPPGVD